MYILSISDQAALLSAYIAAGSFSIVYQLFSLQTWLTRSLQILDRSESIALNFSLQSIERKECVRQSKTHLKTFPKLNLITIGSVQIVLGWLTFCANQAGPLDSFYMITPAAVLLLVFFGATLLVWLEGIRYHKAVISAIVPD